MKLGEKLMRLRAGRSYAEAARAAGCSAPTIRQIESGERDAPSYRIIAGLARFYGVSLDWLVDDEQDWPPAAAKLDDKIIHAVHSALTPFAGMDGISPDEHKLLNSLRSRGIHGRNEDIGNSVYDAFEAVLTVWDAGHHSTYTDESSQSPVPPPVDEIDKALHGRKGEVG